MRIPAIANILSKNDQVAGQNRQRLAEAGVCCINLLGSPGCGKTALLERGLNLVKGQLSVGVLTGDLSTRRDADRLEAHATAVVQINTGRGCHLDATQIRDGMDLLADKLEGGLESLDLLLIENVGNLICPASFDLGESKKVVVFSTPEGADKPAKHASIVLAADLLLLNKVDLLPYLDFDVQAFRDDLALVRSDLDIREVDAVSDAGVAPLVEWLSHRASARV